MQDRNPFRAPVEALFQEVNAVCEAVHRDPSEIQIIGVTKTVDKEAVSPLLEAGIRKFGENRWQQAREKLTLANADEAQWHFIGRLQSNKIKYIARHFHWVHSVTSLALAQELNKRAEQNGVTIQCLLQVNASGEETKDGIGIDEVIPLLRTVRDLSGLQFRGLMTMAPNFDDSESTRPTFAAVRSALEDARQQLSWPELSELSMGMSQDFPVAIEEGATMIRIGRRLMSVWNGQNQE